MIESVDIERFRGIQKLSVRGLGRVNLVTGRNDCGKTAFMEATMSAAQGGLPILLQAKRGVRAPVSSLEGFWAPFFFGLDAERGLSVHLNGSKESLAARRVPTPDVLVDEAGQPMPAGAGWSISIEATSNGLARSHNVVGRGNSVQITPVGTSTEDAAVWVTSASTESTDFDLRVLTSLQRVRGGDAPMVDLMRLLNPEVEGIQILSPTGVQAAVYVRSRRTDASLPLASMGEGTRRCFDLAIGVVSGRNLLFVDEIDNGLHHSILADVWTWIATVSKQRSVQVFATTHSDECIRAAAHAFQSLGDDGLRLLRLDRGEHETTVAVYDRDLLLVAEADDVEVRG